jgi:hypothetical protein
LPTQVEIKHDRHLSENFGIVATYTQVYEANQMLFLQISASGVCTGADVMITIFCVFRQFSAKKLEFFSKTNVRITIFFKI